MKRRDFIKGLTAIGAISAAPKLIASEAERQLADAKILHNGPVRGALPEGYQVDRTLTDNESWFLSTETYEHKEYSRLIKVKKFEAGEALFSGDFVSIGADGKAYRTP